MVDFRGSTALALDCLDRTLVVNRIALMPSAYLPSLGGVEELTRHLALALVRRGDEVEVWTQQADGQPASVDTVDGLTVRRFPFPLPTSQFEKLISVGTDGARTLSAMRQAARRFNPDVLHVQCFGPNGAYATALASFTRIPLMVTLQGETMMDDQDIFDVSVTLRTALRAALRQAKAVTACSRFTLQDAEDRFGLAPGRGTVIFNGVAVGEQPASSTTETRYVLALGRVVEKKGFDLLLQAFARVAERFPDVELRIGGSGPAEDGLRQLIAQLGLPGRAKLLGRLSREQVATAMAGAEVFVMPSRLEPFGIVVLEAWRAGRAVIATSRGGPAEFVQDGTNGLLVDPFDTAALGEALARLLGDPALRQRLGDAARRRVADFDWAAIAERYSECYRQVRGL